MSGPLRQAAQDACTAHIALVIAEETEIPGGDREVARERLRRRMAELQRVLSATESFATAALAEPPLASGPCEMTFSNIRFRGEIVASRVAPLAALGTDEDL